MLERWYDIEAGCYVDEEPPLGLQREEQRGSAVSSPAYDHYSPRHSPRPSHQMGQHDHHRSTRRTSEEPTPYSLADPLDEVGGAFEEPETSSATVPSSPRYYGPSYPQIDQEDGQGGSGYGRLDGLGYGTSPRDQDHGEEQQGQQQQKVAVEAMGEGEGDDDDGKWEQLGKKRRHQDEMEQIRSSVHYSGNGDHRHDTSSEDEDPRPSWSPSAAMEAVPVAEYQEWPFQGFFKRTKIGGDIMYNLEFKLPCISARVDLPIDPELLGISPSREAPAKAPDPHEAVAYSKIRQAPLRPQTRRARWTPEEDATLLQMRNDGRSWEDIHAALSHRGKGAIQVRYWTKLRGTQISR